MTQSEHVLRMADLRRACSVLLDETERRFGDEVDLAGVLRRLAHLDLPR
ncbi:hypothetical protein ACH4S8_40210 [Streptomyces sp. NPDC021080]